MNFASNLLQLAQRLLANRVPRRQIETFLQMRSKTISAIKSDTYRTGRRPGRSLFVSQSMLDFMETKWAADSRISDGSTRETVNEAFGTTTSTSTVWRCRQPLKFVCRPRNVVPDLTPKQSISFCHWVLEDKSDLGSIFYGRFQCGPDNQWRRTKRGVCSESCFAKKVKFPKMVMAWGRISAGYRTPLVKCSNGSGNSGRFAFYALTTFPVFRYVTKWKGCSCTLEMMRPYPGVSGTWFVLGTRNRGRWHRSSLPRGR